MTHAFIHAVAIWVRVGLVSLAALAFLLVASALLAQPVARWRLGRRGVHVARDLDAVGLLASIVRRERGEGR